MVAVGRVRLCNVETGVRLSSVSATVRVLVASR